MQCELSHVHALAATSGSGSAGDDGLAAVLVALLALWLLYLTVSLLYDVFRLLIGVKLIIVVAFLVGVPLTAIVVAATKIL
jgi:hypothetical protein